MYESVSMGNVTLTLTFLGTNLVDKQGWMLVTDIGSGATVGTLKFFAFYLLLFELLMIVCRRETALNVSVL